MSLVLLVAMALAALRHPSPLLASVLYSLVLGLVCIAAFGALFGRGSQRRMWSGFGIFAGVYLGLAFAAFPLSAPSLLTTWGLSYLDTKRASGVIDSDLDYLTFSYFPFPPSPTINPASLPFFQVGHCLAALLAGLVGAGVAVFMGRDAAGR
jgi:hypothetical protein